jgi:uncharacterized protein (DUF305 family)
MIWRVLPARRHPVLAAGVLVAAISIPLSATTASATVTTSAVTTSAAAASQDQAVKHDITFMAMMVPHHESGIEMAELAKTKASSDRIRGLAARIHQVQTRQVADLTAWLKRHHAEPMKPPSAVRKMSQQDLEMLRMAKGHLFDAMFLIMMRHHHAQAVAEAEDELHHGRDELAVQMAQMIKSGQTQEIATMNEMLIALHRQVHPQM